MSELIEITPGVLRQWAANKEVVIARENFSDLADRLEHLEESQTRYNDAILIQTLENEDCEICDPEKSEAAQRIKDLIEELSDRDGLIEALLTKHETICAVSAKRGERILELEQQLSPKCGEGE